MIPLEKLPDDPAELKRIIVSDLYRQLTEQQSQLTERQNQLEVHQVKNKQLEKQVSHLSELVRLLKHKHFGKKSEGMSSDQLGLFNEAEIESEGGDEEQPTVEIKGYKRGQPKRKPLPDDLPRRDIIIDLEEKEKWCDEGHPLKEIGQEVSEKLDYLPAKMEVIRTIRKKYACPCCEDTVKTAALPPSILPKSLAGEGLLAFITTSKYVDGLPLYRLEKNLFKRIDIDMPRTTMGRWMVQIGGEKIQPLINLMNEDLLESDYLSCDETRVQVLKEPGKKAESLSYMWVRMRDGPAKQPAGRPKRIILYDYSPSRSGKTASELLEGFKGYLQVDGYEGYNPICEKAEVTRVGCWAHARRRFFDAYKASKKGQGLATDAIKMIKALYKIEERIRDLSIEEKYQARQNESKPLLEKFRQWLDSHKESVPPLSKIGQAMSYTHNEWPSLIQYLEDGRINIDNNPVENAIRPFVIGRKNWLFSDTVEGATASANIYSLVETAKANDHEPYAYLKYLFTELPKAQTVEEIEALLPYNVDPDKIKVEN